MDLDRFEDLKDRYHAKRLVIAGDTDSLAALPDIAELGLPVFTVDTGLHLLAGMGLRADLLWLQDESMLTDSRYLIEPHLRPTMSLCLPHHLQHLIRDEAADIVEYYTLGQLGFSHDPRIGTFEGYDPIYGLLQLVSWIGPKHLSVVGVDIGQGFKCVESAPRKPTSGLRRNKVLHIMKALSTVRAQGIDVEILSDLQIAPLSKVGT